MVQETIYSIGHYLPEIVMVLTLCAIIVADLVIKGRRHAGGWVLLAGLFATGYAVVGQFGVYTTAFSYMVAVDPFAAYFKFMIVLTAILVTAFSMRSKEIEAYASRNGEYYMLLAGMVLGMLMMVGSANILLIYLAFEVTSLSSYVLTGFTKRSPRSAEASIKYIVYGSVSSAVMIYGISLLVGLTATTDLYSMASVLGSGMLADSALLLNLSVLMILVGMGFKIAVVPFHFWAPDVYEGAPFPVASVLAVGSKIAAFGLLIRFFLVAFSVELSPGAWMPVAGVRWDLLLGVMAALAMLVGNLTALRQENIKRMLAYSSIAHAGYLLMGLVVLTGEGLTALMFYLFVYLFMNLGAFYVAMLFSDKAGVDTIAEYKGLGHRAPLQGVALTLFLVSLTGLPPTGGFVAKLFLFGSAISAGWIWLVVVAGIATIISLFYYIRVVRVMYFEQPEEGAGRLEFSTDTRIVLLFLLIPTLMFGVYFSPLMELARSAAVLIGF